MGMTSHMTMRATITRKVEQGVDDYGQPITKDDVVGIGVSCYCWFDTGNSDRTRGLDAMELQVNRAFITWRHGQDIQKGDRVEVYDRRGNLLYDVVIESGPIYRRWYLLTVARKYGE